METQVGMQPEGASAEPLGTVLDVIQDRQNLLVGNTEAFEDLRFEGPQGERLVRPPLPEQAFLEMQTPPNER